MTERWNLDYGPPRGLYRDKENGWIFGVCAGVADYFNFRTGTVRIITLVCLLLFFWPTLAVYFGLTLLIREKPLTFAGRSREHEFWRRDCRNDRWSHS